MKNITMILFLVVTVMIACSCNEQEPVTIEQLPASIPLTEVKVTLPDAEGKDLVTGTCIPCHSLRYIEMQPELSRAAWEKTVKKMIHTYGAPVADSTVEQKIIDYLVAIKGKK